MNIKERIKQLRAQGKSTQEIAAIIRAEFSEEAKDIKALITMIDEIKAEEKTVDNSDIELAMKEIETDKKFAEQAKELDKLNKTIENLEKALKVDPTTGKRAEIAVGKFFNFVTCKYEDEKVVPESYEKFADLMLAISQKDKQKAMSLSNEIDSLNEKVLGTDRMSAQQKAALRTDATTGIYAIPTEVAMEIINLVYNNGQSIFIQNANRQTITYNDKVFPVIFGGDMAWIADENTAVTENTPSLDNPTASMERFGAIYLASNTLLQMKGQELVSAFVAQAASNVAQFLDQKLVVGSTNAATPDLIDGIVFDDDTAKVTATTFESAGVDNLKDVKNAIDLKVRDRMIYMSNEKVADKFGLSENSNGAYVFPGYVEGRGMTPFGRKYVVNNKIPSTLNLDTDENATGSNDVLIGYVPDYVYVNVANLRIDTSKDYKFAEDQFAWRIIGKAAVKAIAGSSSAGVVVAVQELTN